MDLEFPEICKTGVLPYYGTDEAEPFESTSVSRCLGNLEGAQTVKRKMSG